MVAHEADNWRPALVAGPTHEGRSAHWAQSLPVDSADFALHGNSCQLVERAQPHWAVVCQGQLQTSSHLHHTKQLCELDCCVRVQQQSQNTEIERDARDLEVTTTM